ncbi:MAG TPA: zinc-dependent alcohol dehydrogenase family protein, partial [Firmicutes bacterium]|nr:zinc-dependent alcohol dehydrogenase family protein [Bacillota bacterium]
ACGVCGTDFHIYRGEAPARPPVILGHEYFGEIVATGREVEGLGPGDIVAIDPNIPCGECYFCRIGKPHLCESSHALGVTIDGGFAEYSVAPASQCHKLPGGVNMATGVFVEPVACCLHGIDLAGIRPGNTVVILGAGTIGLILMQLARLSGASELIVSDPLPDRRNLAVTLGATRAVDSENEDLAGVVRTVSPAGADVVIEAVGMAKTVKAAIELAARGGTVLIFGVSPEGLTIPVSPFEIYKKELKIQGSYVNPYTSSRAVKMLVTGQVEVEALAGRRISLAALPDLLKSERGQGGAKTLVVPSASC